MVYLSQEKTITYYPEGYSFLLFVGVGGGAGVVKQSFCALTLILSHTASF